VQMLGASYHSSLDSLVEGALPLSRHSAHKHTRTHACTHMQAHKWHTCSYICMCYYLLQSIRKQRYTNAAVMIGYIIPFFGVLLAGYHAPDKREV